MGSNHNGFSRKGVLTSNFGSIIHKRHILLHTLSWNRIFVIFCVKIGSGIVSVSKRYNFKQINNTRVNKQIDMLSHTERKRKPWSNVRKTFQSGMYPE